jgi:hypothetical protein
MNLADSIRTAPIPRADDARERGVEAVATAMVASPAPSPARRRWLVPAAVALAIVLALSLTPPGRAVAEWAAELVGIGEVGGPPSVNEPVIDTIPSSEQVVVATGETPNGQAFEVVIYRTDQLAKPNEDPLPTGNCIQTVFPDQGERFDGGGSGGCSYGSGRARGVQALRMGYPGPRFGGAILEGEATPRARRVEVSYETRARGRRETVATVAFVRGSTAQRVGIERPTTYFVAFMPGLARPEPPELPRVELVARDGRGAIVARDDLSRP